MERDYRSMIAKFGTEFEILKRVPKEELLKGLASKIAEGILRVRERRVNIKAGFDGEYGKISIFEDKETEKEEQLRLF